MNTTTICLLSLLLAGSAVAATSAPAMGTSVYETEFDKLHSEFELTFAMWNQDMYAATPEDRTDLFEAHPARDFWEQFKTLAEGGEGQAYLWMARHHQGVGKNVVGGANGLVSIFNGLASKHTEEAWFEMVFEQVLRSKTELGDKACLAFYETVISQAKRDEIRAGALFGAGFLLTASEDKNTREKGEAFLTVLEKDLAETRWAKMIPNARLEAAVQVGRKAPNFKGKTIDGFEFNLTDYKGKVVLLDFFGFW